jgi:hypothetical protein
MGIDTPTIKKSKEIPYPKKFCNCLSCARRIKCDSSKCESYVFISHPARGTLIIANATAFAIFAEVLQVIPYVNISKIKADKEILSCWLAVIVKRPAAHPVNAKDVIDDDGELLAHRGDIAKFVFVGVIGYQRINKILLQYTCQVIFKVILIIRLILLFHACRLHHVC